MGGVSEGQSVCRRACAHADHAGALPEMVHPPPLTLQLVMLLQHTISAENMLIWGWRIPFLLAAGTAVLGYFLRRGLPEPKAFLAAARAEKKALGGESLSAKDLMPMASLQVSSKDIDLEDTTKR